MGTCPKFYLWINNEASDSKHTLTITNPFDRSAVADVALADETHLEQAIRGCVRACAELADLPRCGRADLLARVVEGLREARSELIDTLILEGGKPRTFAEIEFERTLSTFSWAAEEAKRFAGEVIPMDGLARGIGYEGYTLRVPIGPVFGICPFNFPLNLVAHKVAPSVAVGNPCLIKPSSETPISALILARIFTEAGAPSGTLNVLPMTHQTAAKALSDERVKLVSFTGSAEVGWRLKERIGKKRIILELGGNSGTIVDATADPSLAAERCALGGFAQAGQSCISVQRIYVHHERYSTFLERLVEEAKRCKAGDPLGEEVVVGPVINDAAANRILSWIDEAVEQGAKVLTGGKRLQVGCGNVIEPTVITEVDESMKVCSHEIFGPVVTVTPYRKLDEAIAAINASRYGLQAAIFSRDIGCIHRAIHELKVGGVVVNDVPTYRVDHMPYGGVKDSGLGREGIRCAMLEMSEVKMVSVRILH